MHFNKVCDELDWDDPGIREIMLRELHLPADIPGKKERKHWEWAMGFQALKTYGFLNRNHNALGVGSGHEVIMYALANHLGSVTATDLYGDTQFRDSEADPRVLQDPSVFCSFPYERNRLEVKRMDATRIEYPDRHFDIIFSFSSIEHFGDSPTIVRAMKEACRVLKDGGIYVLSVDYIFRSPWPPFPRRLRWDLAGELFDRNDVLRLLIHSAGFRTRERIFFDVPPGKITNLYDIISRRSSTGEIHPHIYLACPRTIRKKLFLGSYLFSSLFLALFK